jgi:hypothetical protein
VYQLIANMNNDEEAAVAVLLGMKGTKGSLVKATDKRNPKTKTKHGFSLVERTDTFHLEESKHALSGKRSRIIDTRDDLRLRQFHRRTHSTVKTAQYKDVEHHLEKVKSPVSVTSTQFLATVSSCTPNLNAQFQSSTPNFFDTWMHNQCTIPNSQLGQCAPTLPKLGGTHEKANILENIVSTLIQLHVSSLTQQDIASAILTAEIEKMKVQLSVQQQVQHNDPYTSSLLYLLPNMQHQFQTQETSATGPFPTFEGIENNAAASALIASWLAQICTNAVP